MVAAGISNTDQLENVIKAEDIIISFFEMTATSEVSSISRSRNYIPLLILAESEPELLRRSVSEQKTTSGYNHANADYAYSAGNFAQKKGKYSKRKKGL